MKIKKQHRLLSLVFSLALVISALGIGVPTSAEGEVTTPITTISWNLWKYVTETAFSTRVPGTNNLNGQFCDVNFIENGEPSEASSNFSDWSAGFWFNAKVTDRDVVLAPASGTTITADKTDGQTSNYWRLRFKINGVLNNPQSFVFYPHKSNITEIPNHYEVFVSDKQDGDGSTKIIDIYNTTDRAGDVIDVSGLNLTAIRYVEIRFYDTGRDNWNQAITEIGFFGGTITEDKTVTAHTSFANKTDAQNAVTAAGTNHLSGQNYEDSTFHNGANFEQTETIKADKIAKSTFFNSIIDDSSIGAWHTNDCEASRVSNDVFQTSSYREMVVGLSEAVNNPEKFVFSFHPGGGLPSRHYSVYMSDKRDTLFDDVSKVIEITDSKARVGDLIDLTGLNIKNVLYVGIRIYSFGMTYKNGCKIQHISEIGLYGGTVLPSDAHTTYASASEAPISGVNQLKNCEITAKFYNNGEETLESSGTDLSLVANGIIDNKTIGSWHSSEDTCYSKDAANDIIQTDNYWQLKVDLATPVNNPERFTIVFHPTENGLASQHYAVFAASSEEELFNEDNKVCEITDISARTADSVDLSDKVLTGIKYFGIRFYHCGYTNDNGCLMQHVSEIGLYNSFIGDMNMDGSVDILDLVRLKKYNVDSTVTINSTNELFVDFEGDSAQLAALRRYLLTGSWHMPTLFADEGYTYVWGDEFNADTLNSGKWVSEATGTYSDRIYSNETNLTLDNNSLNLRVYGETSQDGTTTYHVAEGLRTHSTMNFQYGYLEMKIKAPIQNGVWPAFWLSGLNGSYSDVFQKSLTRDTEFTDYGTEIDILEQYRTSDIFYTTLHKWYPGAKNALKYNDCTYKFDGEYHIYGFKWTSKEISIYVDGTLCYSYDLSDNFDKEGYTTTMDGFRSPHYLRIGNDINTAANGWTDSPLTGEVDCALSVDWIRLYQIPGVGGLWTK